MAYATRSGAVVADSRRLDAFGRPEPRQLNVALFAGAVPGLLAQFKRIPGEVWAEDVDEIPAKSQPLVREAARELEGTVQLVKVAVVTCPCKQHEHRIRIGALVGCQCNRYYIYTGSRLLGRQLPEEDGETSSEA